MNHPVLRRLRWSVLLTAALFLVACPYGSEHPLGSPADAVADDALLGTWRATDEDGEQLTITIRRSGGSGSAGDSGYIITAENPEEGEPASMPAFVADVDGERFLNIREEMWYFLNYRILDGRVLLRVVDDALFESKTFASPEALRVFLRENLADPRLYGEADDPEWDWVLDRAP